MTRRQIRIFVVLVSLLACIGCKKAPVDQGTSAAVERYVYRVNDSLHLALGPLELESLPIDKAALRAKFPNPRLPPAGFIQHFHFFVPGETTLSNPEKYHQRLPMDQVDENIVKVRIIEPWTEERLKNQTELSRDARIYWNLRAEHALAKGEKPEEILGMQCFRSPSSSKEWPSRDCLAERAANEWARFDLTEKGASVPFPMLSTRYFTKAYGGLTVAWSVHTKHAAKWREIDEKLWRLIDQWNVALQASPQ